MKRFDYIKVNTVNEAINVLDKHKGKAKIFAGGTDLLVQMKQRSVGPELLVDIKGISDLCDIKWNNQGLRIGPLATHTSIASSSIIQEKFGLLADASLAVSAVQIRNRGTIGGNICNASPSADTAPALLALDAKVNIVSTRGKRTVMIKDFFSKPFKTVLEEDELLTEIEIPNLPPHSGDSYLWLSKRTEVDDTLVGVAVVMAIDVEGKFCTEVKIGLGSVAPTPIRGKKTEEFLNGKKIEDGLFAKAGQIASYESMPRSREEYRRKMVEHYVEQALNKALAKIR